MLDPVQIDAGEIRTHPTQPNYGQWGFLIGNPPDGKVRGKEIDNNGQALIYPTTEMVRGDVGTLEFMFSADQPKADDAVQRVLLDTWPNGGPSRITLSVTGAKITLAMTGENNQTTSIDGTPNWGGDVHSVTILWDAKDLTLLWDRNQLARADKPNVPGREPLGVVLGNNRDLNAPAKMSISGPIRFSSAREVNPAPVATKTDNLTAKDRILRMARGYDRRLYPLLEQLRRQNVHEVDYIYALAYSDINELDLARQKVENITRDANDPLYVQAIFLRSDLLMAQKDSLGAFEQLQVLENWKIVETAISARVKQAMILAEQGNQSGALQIINEIIAKYPDMDETAKAYMTVGQEQFKNGNFQGALSAFTMASKMGSKAAKHFAIGFPLEIKVTDPKLTVRSTDSPLPVTVTSKKTGDKETVFLKPAFSRGVYFGSIPTELGEAKADDGKLQVTGDDTVTILYADPLASGKTEPKSFTLTPSTDAQLVMMAQSALDIYREATGYIKKNILDDNWTLVGVLPKTSSAFFRDPENGNLRKKGYGFDRGFIQFIKPGQSVYLELNDPDLDISANKDTVDIQLATQAGKTQKVTLTETDKHTGIFTATLATTAAGQPQPNMLEVNFNDVLTASYTDDRPTELSTEPPTRTALVQIKTMDGTIACGMDFPDPQDKDSKVFVHAYRVNNGANLVAVVTDRDLDTTDAPDKVNVKIKAESGADSTLTLTETGNHTGVFTGKFSVVTTAPAAADPDMPALVSKPGDVITADYNDTENPSSAAKDVLYTFKMNKPENATFAFQRQVVKYPKVDKNVKIGDLQPLSVNWEDTQVLEPGNMYRINLLDPDLVPTTTGEMWTKMTLKSQNGSTVDVPLRNTIDEKTMVTTFSGQFYIRLGDAGSPPRAYLSQTGSVIQMNEDQDTGDNMTAWSFPSLNVQGKDKVQATYLEPLTDDGKRNVLRTQDMRVGADAEMAVLNLKGNPLELLKPGMPFVVQVTDASGDLTPKRDALKATLTSSGGDKMDVDLMETDNHSGVFEATVKTAFGASAVKNVSLQVPFEGKVTITYHDDNTVAGTPADVTTELTTRPMAEAEGVLLTKIFDDPKFEQETLVRLGESLYAVGAAELVKANLPKDVPHTNDTLLESARLLQQVIDRFPNSEFVVECLYLTGKIRREQQDFDAAAKLFNRVVEEYPDSDFVPQALYQLVLLYYDQNDIEKATDSAMYLIYGFPKNSLVADAFLHIAEFYYNKATKVDKEKELKVRDYLTSAFIYKRVIDRFPDNPRIELILYRMATAYYRAGLSEDQRGTSLNTAIRYYLDFAENHKDHELADDALYWAATAYMKQGNVRRAYTLLIKQLITYPTGDMKAYAQRLRDQIKEKNPQIEAEQF